MHKNGNIFVAHTIKQKDVTLSDIALHYTRNADNWPFLERVNPGLDVMRLSLGQVVYVPTSEVVGVPSGRVHVPLRKSIGIDREIEEVRIFASDVPAQ